MPFKSLLVPAAAALIAASQNAHAMEDNAAKRAMAEYALEQFRSWINQPDVVRAILAQNQHTTDLDQDDIAALDGEWRRQFSAREKPMIEDLMTNPLSQYLSGHVANAKGMVTEVIVFDARGLNVGQSALTSDYWQGDEEKYTETYLVGPQGLHVSGIEQGEAPTIYQNQVSMSIADPKTEEVIGAVTISLNAWYFY